MTTSERTYPTSQVLEALNLLAPHDVDVARLSGAVRSASGGEPTARRWLRMWVNGHLIPHPYDLLDEEGKPIDAAVATATDALRAARRRAKLAKGDPEVPKTRAEELVAEAEARMAELRAAERRSVFAERLEAAGLLRKVRRGWGAEGEDLGGLVADVAARMERTSADRRDEAALERHEAAVLDEQAAERLAWQAERLRRWPAPTPEYDPAFRTMDAFVDAVPDWDKLADQSPDEEGAQEPDDQNLGPLQRMDRQYRVVNDGGRFYVFYKEHDPVFGREAWYRSRKQDFRDLHVNRRIETEGGRTKSLADAWLEWGERRTYRGAIFSPGEEHDGWLNLWTGWGVEPAPGDWSLFERLIRESLAAGDRRVYEYLLNWCATLFQRPSRPGMVAPCFYSPERGVGKSTFGRVLIAIAGRHGMQVTSAEPLTGKFNAHLRDLIVLAADEVVAPGDRAAVSKLKGLITEPTISIEGKGKDIDVSRNLLHVVMSSNHPDVAPQDLEERRYLIQRVDPLFKGNSSFWRDLTAQMFADPEQRRPGAGCAAFLHDMLRRDVSGFDPEDVPRTLQAVETIIASLANEPGASEWLEALRNPPDLLVRLGWGERPVELWGRETEGDKAQLALEMGAIDFRELRAFGAKLGMTAKPGGVRLQRKVSGTRDNEYGLHLPSLDEMRRKFRDLAARDLGSEADDLLGW